MSLLIMAVALSFAGDEPQIPLDTIAMDRAEELDGQIVVASVLTAKPIFVYSGRTLIGGPDHLDGIERGIMLNGERFDLREGERITVRGRLRVIDHPPALVGVVFVPAWREIRVTEIK